MNYLLFASQNYSIDIMRPLQQAIIERGDQAAWFLYNVAADHLTDFENLLTTVEQVKDFNPLAVFVPGNWVPDFFPGIKVELFHGFGIEKKGHFDIRGSFDLYCTHGPATTLPFLDLERKYRYFHVIETGWPKMDPLFTNNSQKNQIKNVPKKSITILYAPTFSPSLTSAEALFEEISSISRESDYNWIIKFHPKVNPDHLLKYKALEKENFKVSSSIDILPLLKQADIMITDTSSVISEFLLLDKPVITFNNRTPGKHTYNITSPGKLIESIDYALNNTHKIMKNARNYIAAMHPYRDGLSSLRVLQAVDTFISEYKGRLKNKPINLFRRLKCRMRLNYFRL